MSCTPDSQFRTTYAPSRIRFASVSFREFAVYMSPCLALFDRLGRQLVVSPSANEPTFGRTVHIDRIDPKATEHFWLEALKLTKPLAVCIKLLSALGGCRGKTSSGR
jgi:hypothetical protein